MTMYIEHLHRSEITLTKDLVTERALYIEFREVS